MTLKKKVIATLFALALTTQNTGCNSLVRRTESLANNFITNFNREYEQRSDPNFPQQNKYGALQRLGELQRRVHNHELSPIEARERVTQQDYEDAFDAVTDIAKSSFQDALRQSTPELVIAENLPTIGANAITDAHSELSQSRSSDFEDLKPRIGFRTSLSDFLKPSGSLSTRLHDERIEFEPSIRLGRIYRGSYNTREEKFDHRFRYGLDQWFFQLDIEHDLRRFHRLNATVNYSINAFGSIGAAYSYDRAMEDHVIGLNFTYRF